jgi:hypothetical protein
MNLTAEIQDLRKKLRLLIDGEILQSHEIIVQLQSDIDIIEQEIIDLQSLNRNIYIQHDEPIAPIEGDIWIVTT